MTRRRYATRTPSIQPPVEQPGHRELVTVREIVHAFLRADRPEDVFQFALDRVSPVVGASFASVYLVDGASELMRLVAASNWPEKHRPWLGDIRVRMGFGPSGEAASERRTIEVPDVFADPDLEDWHDVARELGFKAIVAQPLQTSARVLGTVAFYFKDAGNLTAEKRGLLRIVADQMAATAEKAELVDQLRRANAALVESNAELERQYVAVVDANGGAFFEFRAEIRNCGASTLGGPLTLSGLNPTCDLNVGNRLRPGQSFVVETSTQWPCLQGLGADEDGGGYFPGTGFTAGASINVDGIATGYLGGASATEIPGSWPPARRQVRTRSSTRPTGPAQCH